MTIFPCRFLLSVFSLFSYIESIAHSTSGRLQVLKSPFPSRQHLVYYLAVRSAVVRGDMQVTIILCATMQASINFAPISHPSQPPWHRNVRLEILKAKVPLSVCSFRFAAALLVDLLLIPLDPPVPFLFAMLPFFRANVRSKKAPACPTGDNLIPPVRPSENGLLDCSNAAGSFVPAQHTLEDIPVVPVIPSKAMLPKRRVVSMPVSAIEMGEINRGLSQEIDQNKISVSAKMHRSEKVSASENVPDSEKLVHKPNAIAETKISASHNSPSNRQSPLKNRLASHEQRPLPLSRPPPAIDPNLVDIAGSGSGALAQRRERLDPPTKTDNKLMHSFKILKLGHPGKKLESKPEKGLVSSPTLVVLPSSTLIVVLPSPPPKDMVISQPKSRASVKRTNLANGPILKDHETEKEATMAKDVTISHRPASAAPSADSDRFVKMSKSGELNPPPMDTPPESTLQAYLDSLVHCSQRLLSEKVLEIFDTYMSLGSTESVTSEVSSAHSGALEISGDTISTSSVYSDDVVDNLNETDGLLHRDAKASAEQSTATVSCTPVDRLLPHVPPVLPIPNNSTLVPLLSSFYFSEKGPYDGTSNVVPAPETRPQHRQSPQPGTPPRNHPEVSVSDSMNAYLPNSAYRMPLANLNVAPLHFLNQVRLVQVFPSPQICLPPFSPREESAHHIRLPHRPPHTWQPMHPSPPPPSPPPHAPHLHYYPKQNPVMKSPLPSLPHSQEQGRRFQTAPLNNDQKHDLNPNAASVEIPEVMVLTPSQSRAEPLSLPLPNVHKHRVFGPSNRQVSHEPCSSPPRGSLEQSLTSVHRRRVVSEHMGPSEPMGFCLDMGADYRASRFMIPKTVKIENDYSPENRQFSPAYVAYRNKGLPVSPSEDETMNAKMDYTGNHPSMTSSERSLPRPSTIPVFQVRSFTNQKQDVAKDKGTKHRSFGPLFKKLLH